MAPHIINLRPWHPGRGWFAAVRCGPADPRLSATVLKYPDGPDSSLPPAALCTLSDAVDRGCEPSQYFPGTACLFSPDVRYWVLCWLPGHSVTCRISLHRLPCLWHCVHFRAACSVPYRHLTGCSCSVFQKNNCMYICVCEKDYEQSIASY